MSTQAGAHHGGLVFLGSQVQFIKNQFDFFGDDEFDSEPTSVLDLTPCISPPLQTNMWSDRDTTMDYEQEQREIIWERQQILLCQQQNQQLWEQHQLCLWEQQQAELQHSQLNPWSDDQYSCGVEDIMHHVHVDGWESSSLDLHLENDIGAQLRGRATLGYPSTLEDWISSSGNSSLASASEQSSRWSLLADDLDSAISTEHLEQVMSSTGEWGSTDSSQQQELELQNSQTHDHEVQFGMSNFDPQFPLDNQFPIVDMRPSSNWFLPVQQPTVMPLAKSADIPPSNCQLPTDVPYIQDELTHHQHRQFNFIQEPQLQQPFLPVAKNVNTLNLPKVVGASPKSTDLSSSSSPPAEAGIKASKLWGPHRSFPHLLGNNESANIQNPISRKRSSSDLMIDEKPIQRESTIAAQIANSPSTRPQSTGSGPAVTTLAELTSGGMKMGGVQLPILGTQIPIEVRLAVETQASGLGGVRMVQLLLACAEAVACRDSRQANILLQQLQHMASPYGDAMQRITACFVGGLTARLAMTGYEPFTSKNVPRHTPSETEKFDGFNLLYQSTPYVAFGHFAANSAILEAFEREDNMHIIDLGMTHALQWPYLMHGLAKRPRGPPHLLRITGFGLATDNMKKAGEELERIASELNVPFEFRAVTESLEGLKRPMLQLREGEALAVNSVLQLHSVVKESRGSLNAVLQHIRELSPKILTLVEQDASHNGPFFLGRFMEALHYYSAIFDSVDVVLPRNSKERVKIEQSHFAEEIKNIISCEGPARVERHERIDQWRRRMSRAGFQPLPLKFLSHARMWLGLDYREDYTLSEEKGCLVLGWKGKPIIAASSWRGSINVDP